MVIIGDAVVNEVVGGEPIVVFSRGIKRTSAAFDPRVNGKTLTFRYEDEGITDEETGSTWSTGGMATGGKLESQRLKPLPTRNAFWISISGAIPGIDLYLP